MASAAEHTTGEAPAGLTLYYPPGRVWLIGAQRAKLRAFARTVLKGPGTWRVRVECHADHPGTPDKNMWISERRCIGVRRTLRKSGLPHRRVELRWVGETRALGPEHRHDPEQRSARLSVR